MLFLDDINGKHARIKHQSILGKNILPILGRTRIYSIPIHHIGTLTTAEYFPSRKSTSLPSDARVALYELTPVPHLLKAESSYVIRTPTSSVRSSCSNRNLKKSLKNILNLEYSCSIKIPFFERSQ